MNKSNKISVQILTNLKIEELNPMQQALLNPSLDKKDLILLSPTGSGKTLAFLLALLRVLTDSETDKVQALILTPSRELALQINEVFKTMKTSWKMYCCYGGHSFQEEKKSILQQHPEVIVATPGRISDHIRRGTFNPENIHTLILDEFDKLLELGFEQEMTEIISQLPGLKKRMLISATNMEDIPLFTGLTSPVKLDFLHAADEAERLKQWKVLTPVKDKIDTLSRLLCTLGNQRSIVFGNHRDAVERVYKLLSQKGFCCELFHGGMEQADREKALVKFRNGSSNVLISTDLASRGLDIPYVEHIIHYHLPVSEEAFIHRNGRTARWESGGNSYLLLNETDVDTAFAQTFANTEEYILSEQELALPKPVWSTLYIGKGKKDKLSKMDVVGFLYKKGMLSRDDVGIVEVKEHCSFVAVRRNKVKQLLTLISGEKIKGMKTIICETT